MSSHSCGLDIITEAVISEYITDNYPKEFCEVCHIKLCPCSLINSSLSDCRKCSSVYFGVFSVLETIEKTKVNIGDDNVKLLNAISDGIRKIDRYF